MPLLSRQSQKVAVLADVPLFADLSKKELTALARISDELEVREGTELVHEGKWGHQFAIVLEGKAVVRRNGRKVAESGPGAIIGEIGLVTDRPANATVVVSEPSTLLVLDPKAFRTMMAEMPSVATKILGTIADRLAETDSRAT